LTICWHVSRSSCPIHVISRKSSKPKASCAGVAGAGGAATGRQFGAMTAMARRIRLPMWAGAPAAMGGWPWDHDHEVWGDFLGLSVNKYIRGFQSWGKSTCLPVGKSSCTFFLTSRLACMQASQTVVHPSFNLYNFFSLITPWEHCRATCQAAGKSTCLYFESRFNVWQGLAGLNGAASQQEGIPRLHTVQ
jgi:hypothetical protein